MYRLVDDAYHVSSKNMLFLWIVSSQAATPLRVAMECQSQARVDACTYLQGALDAQAVVAVVPRSDAQVLLYVNATTEASEDKIFLRFVSNMEAVPLNFEQLVSVDSRLSVDEQREQLEPVLLRGLAPYVSITFPDAVQVTFQIPEDSTIVAEKSSPWGLTTWMGGWGSWLGDYQDLSVWVGGALYRITDQQKQMLSGGYDRSIERQPSLDINGSEVSLTSDSSASYASLLSAWNLNDHWTVGGIIRNGHDDPEGQFLLSSRFHTGVEYNHFPSDDPRGNQLAVGYLIGGQWDQYNQTNALGQDQALFPTHMILATGSIRVDTVEIELDLSAQAELLHPTQRYVLGANGSLDLTLGDHVDLSMEMGLTQQAIPGPATLDRSSYEAVTRASYAEPLDIYGHLNLNIHWDNTNSARNNRFEAPSDLQSTGNL